MQFIAMQRACRISNPLINEQKTAAPADVKVRQHGFCEWISGLDDPWIIQPHSWKFSPAVRLQFDGKKSSENLAGWIDRNPRQP